MAREIDFRALKVLKDSFVDGALRSRYSDLVLSTKLRGRPFYFYVLFEHQRGVEPLMIFRMSVYMHRLWEKLVRDSPGLAELPPIMPLLLHHSQTGWTASTCFQDIIAVDPALARSLRPYIPRFSMRVIDIGGGQSRHLAEAWLTPLGRVVLWCMSVAGDGARLLHEIVRILGALEQVLAVPGGLAALDAVMRYIAATHEQTSVKKVAKLLEEAGGPRTKEGVVTWLDEIEQRGEKRGERRGERKGEKRGGAKLLLRQMEARFGDVPPDIAARIEAAGEALLHKWAVRLLTADSAADVIAGGGEKGVPRRPGGSNRAPRPATRGSR